MTPTTRPTVTAAESRLGAYIPHPPDTRVEIVSACEPVSGRGSSIPSVGSGFTFESDRCYALGSLLTVRVHCVTPPLQTWGKVVRCRKRDGGFEIALEFLDPDEAYATRTVEQICHIRHYQSESSRAGRALSADDAAREWIRRHAAAFPGADVQAAA